MDDVERLLESCEHLTETAVGVWGEDWMKVNGGAVDAVRVVTAQVRSGRPKPLLRLGGHRFSLTIWPRR